MRERDFIIIAILSEIASMHECCHVFFLLCQLVFVSSYQARVWQSLGTNMYYPEEDYPGIMSRPNFGISFSGGGSRSYVASMGYLAALHKLRLVDKFRYVIGVSGGSWATAVYSYYQDSTINDTTLLGHIVSPHEINYEDLKKMDPKCARGFTNTASNLHMLSTPNNQENEVSFSMWYDAVQSIYLSPCGISPRVPFAYNLADVVDIKNRNPNLRDTIFLILRQGSESSDIDSRPLPIITSTLVGPVHMLPFTPNNRNYSLLEVTSLSAGILYTKNLTYNTEDYSYNRSQVVGGLIEPFAFGGNEAPAAGMPNSESTGIINVPDFPVYMDLTTAIAASSFYSGCDLAASGTEVAKELSGTVNYWSPSATNPSQDFMEAVIADGGGLQVSNIVSLIQRGVSTIVMCVSTSVPLQPRSNWNPATDPLYESQIDFTVPAFFGHIATDLTVFENRSYDLSSSQLFPSEDWVPLAEAMQRAQKRGRGIVVVSTHKTVENPFHGISAGLKVKVVWVYLGRSSAWENELSPEMQKLVIPEIDADDMAHLRQNGPFASFPHYATDLAGINFERANLLADFTGWTFLQNADIIQDALANNDIA